MPSTRKKQIWMFLGLKEDFKELSGIEDSDFQKWIMIFCKQRHLPCNRVTDDEKRWLVQISRKSDLLKSGTPQRGKASQKEIGYL